MADGFTMIDNGAIERAHEVGPSAFVVYCAIARHADERRRAWPGIDRLAAMTGLAHRTVQLALSTLRRAGWLVVNGSPGHGNTYILSPMRSSATDCTTPDKSSATDCAQVAQPVAPGSATHCARWRNQLRPNKTKEQNTRTKPLNKTKRGCAADAVFPSELNCEEFKEAWTRWTAHRKELRKPLTPSTTAAQLKKLAAWGTSRAVAAINRSIEAGWQGIFEESGERQHGKQRTSGIGPGQRHPDDRHDAIGAL